MAIPEERVPYTGVATVAPSPAEGTGAKPLDIHATPEAYGAGIGQAEQNAGERGLDTALLFQGLKNEADANNAEAAYIKASGDLKNKFMQNEGLAADAARPQYEADLAATREQYRNTLNPRAQQAFDMMTTRQMALSINEASSYAAGQLKKGNLDSHVALADSAVSNAGDINKLTDDGQVGSSLGVITSSGNAIADIRGLHSQAMGYDKYGNYVYPDTPEGRAAQAQHFQFVDAAKAKYFSTAAKTIADTQGGGAAADWLQKHWDQVPDTAKVQLNQFLAPKIRNEFINSTMTDMKSQMDQGYAAQLTQKVPSSPLDATYKEMSPLDAIKKSEGEGYSKDNKGEVINGINSWAFPKEFAEAKQILQTKGQAAATQYTDAFYQKNIIEKYDISSLPPATQAIVADGLVNHGGEGDFGKSLVAAAQNGATPQQLIEMRRNEYQRLAAADPKLYGPYLSGWNARLDALQAPQGPITNRADYLRQNEDKFVQDKVNAVVQRFPDVDQRMVEQRARNIIHQQISDEDAKLKADNDTVINGIFGAYTKGRPPSTHAELESIPGMKDVLDRVSVQNPQLAQEIDSKIAEASRGDANINSKNGYGAVIDALATGNKKVDEATYHGLFGRKDGTGINLKDYNDVMQIKDASPEWKDYLRKNMQQISVANGNADGEGNARALDFYTKMQVAKKANDALGDKKLTDTDLIEKLKNDGQPAQPSKLEQLYNQAKNFVLGDKPQPDIPVFGKPTGPAWDSLPSGAQFRDSAGKLRVKH